MRRIALTLALFLLLGAIINVAVAWSLALFKPMRYQVSLNGMFEPTTIPNWDVAVIPRWGAVFIYAQASDRMKREGPVDPAKIPQWSLAASPPSRVDAQRERSITEIAYGWPLVASFSRESWPAPVEWGLRIPWFSKYDRRTLPLRPFWPGFAINTIFYAAILWLLFAFTFALRRRMRAHRGRCVGCGYDLRGRAVESNACPECGVIAGR